MRRMILVAICVLASGAGSAFADEPIAPDWSLADADGTTVRLSEIVENGPVVLFFWASWCPYCKALMPHLQSIDIEYAGRVRLLALSFRDDGDPVGLLRKQGYTFTPLPGAGDVAERYGVHGTPGVIIVDSQRAIRFNLYDLARPDVPTIVRERGRSAVAAFLAPHWAAEIRQQLDAVL